MEEYYENNYELMEARYLEDTPTDSVVMAGSFYLKYMNKVYFIKYQFNDKKLICVATTLKKEENRPQT